MGTTALAIAVTYSLAVIAAFWIAAVVWRSTRGTDRKELDADVAAHREKGWLGIVIAFLVTTLLATILLVPYGESAGPDGQVVNVVARQFGFTITPPTVQPGRKVEFRMTTADANHGLGVMTQDNKLLFQAQIVPEHEQRVVYTFDEPGIYRVICFEYCGVGHHVMASQIEVK